MTGCSGGRERPGARVGILTRVVNRCPCVSVVVPFFNNECHIAACIEALLDQDDVGCPVELVFVDNRSEDGSATIVARYAELTVLDADTPGAYAARNIGIRQSQAPVIAFTDADCVVDRDWLRAILQVMSDPTTAILLGHCRYPSTASLALHALAAYENAKTDYVTDRCPPGHHFGFTNNMAIRASVFEEVGLFEQWMRAADSELVHRLAARRPDLQPVYRPAMRVTHMEFLRFRDRLRRLSLYARTNSRIGTFRELGPVRRGAVLLRLLDRS